MTCPICLCEIETPQEPYIIQECCKRPFHKECLDEWFKTIAPKKSCPWCRTRPQEDIEQERNQLLELRNRMQIKIRGNSISIGNQNQDKCKLQ